MAKHTSVPPLINKTLCDSYCKTVPNVDFFIYFFAASHLMNLQVPPKGGEDEVMCSIA